MGQNIFIPPEELIFTYIHSSGPGGQNVNKVATAVQLRFNVGDSRSLSEEHKTRLLKLAGSRMTNDGCLVIEAKRFRTQEKNKANAIVRLQTLIDNSSHPPKPRTATHPTRVSKVKRLESKKKTSETKKYRKKPDINTD